MRRPYYLYTDKHGIFQAEILDPVTGQRVCIRSTKTGNRDEALILVNNWLRDGIPKRQKGRIQVYQIPKTQTVETITGLKNIIEAIQKSNIDGDDALKIVTLLKTMGLIDIAAVKNTGCSSVSFIQFLTEFWNYDTSEYIQDRLIHGFRFSRRYAHGCQKRIENVLSEFFGDRKLNCITTDDLKKLSNQLAARGLSTSTINQILLICCTPLKWCYKQGIIPVDPSASLTRFSLNQKKRGILTETETAAVFSVDWDDKRALTASVVAATTGARLGEILALRKSDIQTDTLQINHSFSRMDGLKCPKNGHTRITPLLPEVKAALLDLLKDNPHKNTVDPFLFYGTLEQKPIDGVVIWRGLRDAFDAVNEKYREIAINEKQEKPEIFIDYKARNISFHSWRHYFCSKISEKIDEKAAAKVTGHLTQEIFRKYADHIETKNIRAVGDAAAAAFGNVLQFKKGA